MNMTLFRTTHDKKNPFTIINNHITTDCTLSYKAKGIWLYAFSKPDDWNFYMSDIMKQSKDGKDSVRAGLKELEEAGYLQRVQHRENGMFSKFDYYFFETPRGKDEELKKTLPKAENPPAVNPTSENPPLLNTEYKPNNNNNKEGPAGGVVVSASSSEKKPDIPKAPIVPQFLLELSDVDYSLKEKLTLKYKDKMEELEAACLFVANAPNVKCQAAMLQSRLKNPP